MSLQSDNNKRIAKNTLFLYFRMFVMMLTALFTSRDECARCRRLWTEQCHCWSGTLLKKSSSNNK